MFSEICRHRWSLTHSKRKVLVRRPFEKLCGAETCSSIENAAELPGSLGVGHEFRNFLCAERFPTSSTGCRQPNARRENSAILYKSVMDARRLRRGPGGFETHTKEAPQGCESPRSAPERAVLEVKIDLESDHNFYAGLTQNIGAGGLFVATHHVRKIGDRSTHDHARSERGRNDDEPERRPRPRVKSALSVERARVYAVSNKPTTLPSVSATRAYAPMPGMGVLGVTTFPPAAWTFFSDWSTELTPT